MSKFFVFVVFVCFCCLQVIAQPPPYEPTDESLKQHPLPDWYQDAKLGIFIHWGQYSYPGWAELSGNIHDVIAEHGWTYWFTHCAYAEWYHNTMHIEGSPTQQYHRQTFGNDFLYHHFKDFFNNATLQWDPNEWASLFKAAGAGYVVLTTKHHDGFTLWPTNVPNPNPIFPDYHSSRDLVGELTNAVRAQQLVMGLYYSGGYDWTFKNVTVDDELDLLRGVPQSLEYINYVDAHWRELIAKYDPYILWNDIGMPERFNNRQLFADYYNQNELGVVNNRFDTIDLDFHSDFTTPEYASLPDIQLKKWESTRGMGFGFGYNRLEYEEMMISESELVLGFIDIVSKNGNLLINVGPMATGEISIEQRRRLESLGKWMDVNGAGIKGSRVWEVAEGISVEEQIPLRFTTQPTQNTLYVFLLDRPAISQTLTIPNMIPSSPVSPSANLLGFGPIPIVASQNSMILYLPSNLPESLALTVSITPTPQYVPIK